MSHANNSFQNLLAQNTAAIIKKEVEPMVVQTAINVVARAGGVIEGNLKKYISNTLSKTVVLEKLLIQKGILTPEEIATAVMDHEDEAWGLSTATDAAKERDTVRLVVRKKAEGQEYGLPYNVMIPSVLAGQSELGKELEPSLVGLSTGETKEVQDEANKVTLELFVTRISRLKETANVQQS